MTNQEHLTSSLQKLEKEFGADAVYDFFSGFHDVVVLGHTAEADDNPHDPKEQFSHMLYRLGARTAESLTSQLRKH